MRAQPHSRDFLNDFSENAMHNEVMKLVADLPADKVAGLPFFDCGNEDDFALFKPKRQLAEVMLNKKNRARLPRFSRRSQRRVSDPPYLLELSNRFLTRT